MHSVYDILMLKKNHTEEQLMDNYVKLSKAYHPSTKHGCHDKHFEIFRAYYILKDSYVRHFYDNFGDSGIEYIRDKRKEYVMTRVFDCENMKLLYIIVLFIIMNIAILPTMVYLNKLYNLSLFIILTPTIIACVLMAVFIFRSVSYCLKYEAERLLKELTYLMIGCANTILVLAQIITLCYVVEFKVDTYKYLWLLPYVMIELMVYLLIFINELAKPNDKTKINATRIIRIVAVHLFLLDINLQYKLIVPILICTSEMSFRSVSYSKVVYACGSLSLLFCSVYFCIEPPFKYLAYVLGFVHINIGVAVILFILAVKGKYSPVCRFKYVKSLDYEI